MIPCADPDRLAAAQRFGTPLYVYDLVTLAARHAALTQALGDGFGLRYAIKANPNAAVLRCLADLGCACDASSIGEVRRARAAGIADARISFTGPGKRASDLAEALGIGAIVLESLDQASHAQAAAARRGVVQPVLLRISPARTPRGFAARMTGQATQFGIDEDRAPAAVAMVEALPNLRLDGLQFYSGSNCLDAAAIGENVAGFVAITQALAPLFSRPLRRLILGAGFGLPYHDGQAALDLAAACAAIRAAVAVLDAAPQTAGALREIELGRWLVGPAGWLLTSVLSEKPGRHADFLVCDAGFNAHLAACGMMGAVLRRNWPIRNLSAPAAAPRRVSLAGPLCTSIDILARDLDLAGGQPGEVLEVALSGAYGLTASPTGFISHARPREAAWTGVSMVEVSGAGDDAVAERTLP